VLSVRYTLPELVYRSPPLLLLLPAGPSWQSVYIIDGVLICIASSSVGRQAGWGLAVSANTVCRLHDARTAYTRVLVNCALRHQRHSVALLSLLILVCVLCCHSLH
jgi:hypothetical protein